MESLVRFSYVSSAHSSSSVREPMQAASEPANQHPDLSSIWSERVLQYCTAAKIQFSPRGIRHGVFIHYREEETGKLMLGRKSRLPTAVFAEKLIDINLTAVVAGKEGSMSICRS